MNPPNFRQLVLTVLLLAPTAPAIAGWPGGVGVLGDSYSDEYQFYSPHRSAGRNWMEILATTRGLNFGEFGSSSRGEPRNQGYAYNWARSDATTDDMIATGQHTGLAAQVARGEVDLVVIFIGGNDFINALKSPDPVARFAEVGPRAEANLGRAVETIQAAHPDVKLVLITVPDIRDLPEFRVPLKEGRLPRAYADAAIATIRHYNTRLRFLSIRDPRVAVLDFDLITKASDRMYPGHLMVGGFPIVRDDPSDAPDHLFLGDVRHLGTVGQGMLASVFVTTINTKFHADVTPLLGREVLEYAGLIAPTGPTGSDPRGLARSPRRPLPPVAQGPGM